MEKATVGMTVRRSGARLRSMAKAHGPLHVLLWQAREAQSALMAAAFTQKTLFNDIAAWASTENRALSDVCSNIAELSSLYTSALAHLALAYKSFRKEMGLVLEGERRCDLIQRKLHEAEEKRIKLRRQVLRAQNRIQTNGNGSDTRRSGDFSALQTQLAEAERGAERAHMEACATSREQEAVKLVVVKSALAKLSETHLKLVSSTATIFEGSRELAGEVPEPPPPGDPISCVRYSGYENTKAVVERVKSQVNVNNSFSSSSATPWSSRTRLSTSRPVSSATPLTSPNSSAIWSPEPSAPGRHEPPPPYNMSYLSNVSSVNTSQRSLSHCLEIQSSGILEHAEDSLPPNHDTSSLYPNIEIENNTTDHASLSSSISSSYHHVSQRFMTSAAGGDNEDSVRYSNMIMTRSENSVIPSAEDENNPRYANCAGSSKNNDDRNLDNISASPVRSNIFYEEAMARV